MKRIFSLITVTFLALDCYSQTEFYDINNHPTDSMSCYYYNKRPNVDLLLSTIDTIKTFFCSNKKIRSVELYKNGKLDGPSYHYYPNGQLMEKVTYKQNIATGVVTQFYQNGKAKFTKLYLNPEQMDVNTPYLYVIINSWDSLGTPMVKNMDGYYRDKYEEGKIKKGLRDSIWITYNELGKKMLVENFSNGVFVEGDRMDETEIIHYDKLAISAVPKGGMVTFYRHVGNALRYPAKARRLGIEGKVFIEFIVERDGKLSDIKIIRGIGGGCDEEALRVVKIAPAWDPGYQRAKPVRQKMVIPIQFKLGL